METLVAVSIYRFGKSVTVYLNGHRVVGPKVLPHSEIVLETNIKLKDLKEALAEYLED